MRTPPTSNDDEDDGDVVSDENGAQMVEYNPHGLDERILDEIHDDNPDTRIVGELNRRGAAVRAAESISAMYNTTSRKARSEVLPQIDGAVDTPPTSADTSSQDLRSTETTEIDANVSFDNQQSGDLGGTVHPLTPAEVGPVIRHQKDTSGSVSAVGSADTLGGDKPTSTATVKEAPPSDPSTDREDDDDSETMSCLEYDHHLSTLQLSPDNLFDDAFCLPQLDLDYRPGCHCNLNRVFRFDDALPLQSTFRQQRKSSSSTDRSRKKEKKKKKDGKQKKPTKNRFLFWKKKKDHRRDHRDDDEPESQQC